ncbi:ferroxidase HEPHL1 isoform X2 [Pelodiscus sinensis]|uniref:ferroxidase HEPHL1 isoform X2 n=1 Tax=Pelodiscus sinensis TaxID=13735 RepID=UPI003F6AE3AC
MPSVIYGGCMQALTFLWLLVLAEAATRTYYVGIVEENWDYAPTGKNLITGQSLTEDEHASEFVKRGANRIGRIYKKAVYKQFTDATYTQEVPKPSWLGFLGPVMKAQEEDIFLVHLKNFASRPYSLHPHGLFYDKDSEGALYPDGTSGKSKEDDFVVPNGNYTYTWPVKKEYAPTMADPTCLTWIYHSHIDTPRDISSGLIGPLLVCKKGSLDESLIQSTDAAKGFALMYSTVDENLSWYIDANIKAFCSDPATVDKEDEGFKNSNKMHAINGYIFGNLPTLEMCAGEFISWYLIGMGNEIDIHSAYFYGHTITNKGHRADTVNLFPATFITVEMIAGNIGKWLLTCQVSEHLQAGMKGLYHVQTCHKNVSQPLLAGQERRYFIAAEAVLWDYGPEGYDQFTGQALNTTGSESEPFFTRGIDRIGGRYWKVQYVEYTDEKFTRKKNQTESTMHLGILGPVIKAEVGDTLLVTFANKAEKNYSIMPHGVIYSKQSEGTPYLDAADPVMDTNSGLVGPLIICRKNTLNHDGTQKGIDKEFYLLFTVFDENLSWYLDKNIDVFIGDPSKVNKEDEDFQESNKMHAVNGYLFGNLPGLVMCKDDKVSWHMIGLGTFTDMHGVHFQGNTIHLSGMTRDTLALFPHSSGTALMQPDRVGVFQVVCRTFDHFVAGMKQLYEVNSCSSAARPGQPYGTMRTYYIAAEEVEWDYAPNKTWALSGKDASYGEIFVSSGEDRIGSKYEKVVYREYTSGEFTEHKVRSAQEEHLAILGPLIHAEVGDSILVIFKNKGIRPYSITAHGIEEVGSEERPGTLITMPGEINTYRWNVPERSGPGTSDPNCISWVYYSTVNFVKDTHSGLIGPLVVCRKGILNEKGLRKDIDSEFALLFLVFDENESWYLNENIEKYLHKFPNYFNYTADFLESNIMHAINGKVYDNLQGLTMKEGANTNWYLIGMGNEIDIHTVHFHGETFIFKTDKDHRADVYDLFPGTFQTIELRADNPGTWLLHCHVADHIHGGMETTFTISKSDNTVPLKGGVTATAYDTITVKHKAPVKDGDQKGINFLGKTLGAREANSVLIALFSIGLVLLIAILIFIILITFQRKRVYYRTVQPKCALPTDSL